MSKISFKGNPVNTNGELPEKGSKAPDARLTTIDLQEKAISDFKGKKVILNIFPSIDTSVCAKSVRTFNEKATALNDTAVLCISKDLPFAHKRFGASEGINNVVSLSDFKNPDFARSYGLEMVDGPLAGLDARAVVVLDEDGNVKYSELVDEISNEPDYAEALRAL